MVKRIFKFLVSKFISIYRKSIAISARVEYSQVSKKAKVWNHCKLFHATVSDYSYIGPYSRVIHTKIGKFCSIGGQSAIGMGTHTMDKLSTSPIFTEEHNGTSHTWVKTSTIEPFKRTTIGNDVWIGQRVMVMGGIKVGDGAVVGAGAIVTKDVPPYAIVAGVPARIIRYRFSQEIIDRLEELQWWNLPENKLRENIHLFQTQSFSMESLDALLSK